MDAESIWTQGKTDHVYGIKIHGVQQPLMPQELQMFGRCVFGKAAHTLGPSTLGIQPLLTTDKSSLPDQTEI